MDLKLFLAKWLVIGPAKWLMLILGSLLFGITSKELEELGGFANGAVLVFATVGFIHLVILLISVPLKGVAWLVTTSSGVTAVVCEGVAWAIIIHNSPDREDEA